MRWLENAIAAISPERAARREGARLRADAARAARAAYDGASQSRRTSGWRRVSTDANAETGGSTLQRLRDASRDMVRNNAHAARARAVTPQNVVGGGIIPSFLGANGKASKEAEAVAREHVDTEAIDAGGQLDLYGIQSLAMGAVFESGEVLLRRRRRRAEDGLPLPFQVQVLESDFLDTSREGATPTGYIVQGVEFDAIGRRVAYWLFDEHPGSRGTYRSPISRRVPAEDIAHAYRVDRPGQVRGVPWLAPVMLAMADYADLSDAYRLRQKIAACFVAFEVDYQGESGAGSPLVGGAQQAGGDRLEAFEPGIIERLGPGRDIKFAVPPGVDGYPDVSRISLREIAVGLNMPPFVLTGDLADLNFSSGRLGWLDYQRAIADYQTQIVIGQMCRTIERWFREALFIGRGVSLPSRAVWTPPAREMINPKEEIEAVRDEVRAGRMNLFDMLRRAGRDPEVYLRQTKEALDLIDDLGLVFDSDPRRVSRAGLTQVRTDNTTYPKIEE